MDGVLIRGPDANARAAELQAFAGIDQCVLPLSAEIPVPVHPQCQMPHIFKPALVIGGVTHKSLAEILRNRRDGLVPEDIDSYISRYIRRERYPADTGDGLRAEHAPIIRGHIESALGALPANAVIADVEHEFTWAFRHRAIEADVTLASRVDVVVRHGGLVDHIDFKTGSQGGDPIQNLISRVTVQNAYQVPSESLRTINIVTRTGAYEQVPSARDAHAGVWQVVHREIGKLAVDTDWIPRPEPGICRSAITAPSASSRCLSPPMAATSDIDQLWNFGDPAGSEAAFRSARESAEPPVAQELTTQIARAQGLQDRFEEAHATLDQIAEEVAGRQRVRYLLERGRLLNSSGSPEGSIPLFLAAVNEAESCGEIGLEIDALHMLAVVAPEEEREGWTQAAINRAAASEDPGVRKWLGSLLHNLGWAYHDVARYELALDTFERSLAWHLDHGTSDTIRIARWSVGRALRSCGQVDRALTIQETLANEFASDTPDGYVFEEIAECLFALGREEEARPYFARAHVALSGDPWLVRTSRADRQAHPALIRSEMRPERSCGRPASGDRPPEIHPDRLLPAARDANAFVEWCDVDTRFCQHMRQYPPDENRTECADRKAVGCALQRPGP